MGMKQITTGSIYLMVAVAATGCSRAATTNPAGTPSDTVQVRHELDRLNTVNADAFMRGDLQGVMALRAPDFHAIGPDGSVRDREAMRNYIEGIINSVRKWNQLSVTIDTLRVSGDTAVAAVSQYLDRNALRPDNLVHHVQTWVNQRETWVRSGQRWLMWRVDQVRNQRRMVDGKPE